MDICYTWISRLSHMHLWSPYSKADAVLSLRYSDAMHDGISLGVSRAT